MNIFRPSVIVGSLPSNLTNGTTADATQVMADLNWIVSQVNANAAPLANAAVTNANNNFTAVQSGVAATSLSNFPTAQQIQNNALQTLSSVLGTNAITARVSAVALGAYVSGQVFSFLPAQQNTGAVTINIDGAGNRAILLAGSNLSGAELPTWKPAIIGYDGGAGAFDLLNGTPYVQGPNIPAAATLNLDAAPGDYNQIDGTANITAMTLSRGREKLLVFNSSPLISNSATLNLGSNITPLSGTAMKFRGESGGTCRLVGLRYPSQGRPMKRTWILSGSGNYTPDPGAVRIDVLIQAGGGGGAGATANNGTAGNPTTFGTMSAPGGNPGIAANGLGGGPTTATGCDFNGTGNAGSFGFATGSGMGGAGIFGGAPRGAIAAAVGADGGPNTGAGGSGGNGGGGTNGGGGSSGAWGRSMFYWPFTTFAYSVGTGGAKGAAGTQAGGNGADGFILVEEYYS